MAPIDYLFGRKNPVLFHKHNPLGFPVCAG
jgi:hypothetical protein